MKSEQHLAARSAVKEDQCRVARLAVGRREKELAVNFEAVGGSKQDRLGFDERIRWKIRRRRIAQRFEFSVAGSHHGVCSLVVTRRQERECGTVGHGRRVPFDVFARGQFFGRSSAASRHAPQVAAVDIAKIGGKVDRPAIVRHGHMFDFSFPWR